jgi:hypothetical protein
VIRDYWSESHEPEYLDQGLGDTPGRDRTATSPQQPTSFSPPTFGPGDAMTSGFGDPQGSPSVHTPHSSDAVQLAAAQLLGLGTEFSPAMTPMMEPQPAQPHLGQLPPLSQIDSDIPISPELFVDDGIFLPGSAYLELHSALRSHIFDTARSAYPSRCPTPSPGPCNVDEEPEASPAPYADQTSLELSDTTPRSVELTKQEEYVLWKNWVDEIAPWVCSPFICCT